MILFKKRIARIKQSLMPLFRVGPMVYTQINNTSAYGWFCMMKHNRKGDEYLILINTKLKNNTEINHPVLGVVPQYKADIHSFCEKACVLITSKMETKYG